MVYYVYSEEEIDREGKSTMRKLIETSMTIEIYEQRVHEVRMKHQRIVKLMDEDTLEGIESILNDSPYSRHRVQLEDVQPTLLKELAAVYGASEQSVKDGAERVAIESYTRAVILHGIINDKVEEVEAYVLNIEN